MVREIVALNTILTHYCCIKSHCMSVKSGLQLCLEWIFPQPWQCCQAQHWMWMSVWTIDTINPIETFNLPPADKNRGSLQGGRGRGTFFSWWPSVSNSRISTRLARKTAFVSTSPAVLLNTFSTAMWFQFLKEGEKRKPLRFIVFLERLFGVIYAVQKVLTKWIASLNTGTFHSSM